MPLTLMEMFHARGFIFLIAVSVTSTVFRISTLLLWARQYVSVSQLSKLAVWVYEETANITVRDHTGRFYEAL